MPITKAINSKANVKQSTNQDYPYAGQQPVINSYYGVSTAAQTVINLGFLVDTAFSDIFFLFVDGKKLTLGSTSDYTFTSVASDGTSSQVTLTSPLVAGLNIQAFKMGLKKEVEFGVDNRFITLYDQLIRAWDQAFGVTSDPTTSSTALTPMPDMTVNITTKGGPIRISYACTVSPPSGAQMSFRAYVDGVAVGIAKNVGSSVAGMVLLAADSFKFNLAAGVHQVKLYWNTNTGTATANGQQRTLLVEETYD